LEYYSSIIPLEFYISNSAQIGQSSAKWNFMIVLNSSLRVSNLYDGKPSIIPKYLIVITTANHPLISQIGDYVPRAVVFGLITRNPYAPSPPYLFSTIIIQLYLKILVNSVSSTPPHYTAKPGGIQETPALLPPRQGEGFMFPFGQTLHKTLFNHKSLRPICLSPLHVPALM
jgi:hypothetical protein